MRLRNKVFVAMIGLTEVLAGCKSELKSDVSAPVKAAPVVVAMSPVTPKQGDSITLDGDNFIDSGSKILGRVVYSDGSEDSFDVTVGDNRHLSFLLPKRENSLISIVEILSGGVAIHTFRIADDANGSVETPEFSVPPGVYSAQQSVSISTKTAEAKIYYTLDGSMPNKASTLYTQPIAVNATQTIKAIGVAPHYTDSAVATATYAMTVTKPTASLAGGFYTSRQLVTLSSATPGASLYYTTDGSQPTTSSALYSGAILMVGNKTLKAIAVKAGYSPSETLAVSYTIVLRLAPATVSNDDGASPTFAVLTNGNVVIARPNADVGGISNNGSVSLYSGSDGTMISTLSGSSAGDAIGSGGIAALKNGNFVIRSPLWDCTVALGCASAATDVGAVTWVSGVTGATGVVNTSNSLVGSTTNDKVGNLNVIPLQNGNYVVAVSGWDCQISLGCPAATVDVGAVTLGNGSSGIFGPITVSNSVVGTTASDAVGSRTFGLTNGNFVIVSPNWDCLASLGCSGTIANVGAVTWVNGQTGLTGPVAASNSLIGSSANDQLGSSVNGPSVTALTNGNYVVASVYWDCQVSLGCSSYVANVGAATLGNGTTGTIGVVNASNSLVGTLTSDEIGYGGVFALTNGNYVVVSGHWDCQVSAGCSSAVSDVGAATWGSGTTGVVGTVNASNSLLGSTSWDGVGSSGSSIVALTNGNYVVRAESWDCSASLGCSGNISNAGAATWGNGSGGTVGFINASNSLVGSSPADGVGGSVVALSNGNYVVASGAWDCQSAAGCAGTVTDVGAVTWGNGTSGTFGTISVSNSLLGTTSGDKVGSVTPLSNGNYVIGISGWDCQPSLGCDATVANVGAVTWGNGNGGTVGFVTASNSLIGSTADDKLSSGGTIALTNGNYVFNSKLWDCQVALGCAASVSDVGAVTWGNGQATTTGIVNRANSLVGTTASDQVGSTGLAELSNGNYVVRSHLWSCSTVAGCKADMVGVGAVTWGDGTKGVKGYVSPSNSLIGGSVSDSIGSMVITALSNGRYLFGGSSWDTSTNVNVGFIAIGDGSSATAAILPVQ